MTSFGGGALVNTPTKHRVCQCVLGAQCCSYAYVFQLVRTRLSWILCPLQSRDCNGQAGKYQISSCCCSFYWKTICIFWCLISSSAVNLCRVHDVTNKSAWHGCVWALSYNPFQLVPTLLGLAPLGGSVWYQALSPGSRRSELRWKYDMRATPSQKLKLQFFF